MAGVRRRLGSLLGPEGKIGGPGPKGDQGLPGLNGLPTGETIASHLQLEGPARTALDQALLAVRSSAGGAAGTDTMAAIRDFGVGTCDDAIAGDSAGNDANEWVRLFCLSYGLTLLTRMRREYRIWDHPGQSWTTFVDAVGVGTPASGGVVMNDTFTRTAADAFGSTSDNGKVWSGQAGKWTINGSAAYPTVSPGTLAFNVGSRDSTLTAETTFVTNSGSAVSRRFYVGSGTAAFPNGVFGQIAITAGGVVTGSLFKVIGGVTTQIGATNAATGIVNNSATPQAVRVRLDVAIQNVKFDITVGGSTVTLQGTITESDYAALGTFAGLMALDAIASTKVESVELATPAVPAQYDGFTILNGSVGGATLQYQQDRLATMFPASTQVDVLIIPMGHNYVNVTPSAFTAQVESFVTAFRALHPNAKVLILSQNPQFPPAPNPGAHAARQMALRAWAGQKGYEYLPVFERFAAQPDGGASLVMADGIHPTTPPVGDLTQWSGARLTADVVHAAVEGRTIRA